VITNLKFSHFSPQNFRKFFGLWCITRKIIKISINVSTKVPFPSTSKNFSAMIFYDLTTPSAQKSIQRTKKKKKIIVKQYILLYAQNIINCFTLKFNCRSVDYSSIFSLLIVTSPIFMISSYKYRILYVPYVTFYALSESKIGRYTNCTGILLLAISQ